jgi:hypothetical protein
MGPNRHLFAERDPRGAPPRCALYGLRAESIEAAVVVPEVIVEEEQSLHLISVGKGERVAI